MTTPIPPASAAGLPDTPPALRSPPHDLFTRRAQRARALAAGHDLADALHFAAALAGQQQTVLEGWSPGPVPSVLLAHCREVGMPPLAPPAWQPDPPWYPLARELARAMLADTTLMLPEPAADALRRIAEADDGWLAEQGRRLLDPDPDHLPDLACAPLIGAALQVAWTAQAMRLESVPPAPNDAETPVATACCPVCGAPPVAAMLRTGGAEDGLRYLQCGLCATEWRLTRSQCSQCGNSRDMTYLHLPELGEQVQAESCPACHAYLKICRMARDPAVDPWADDLATLALDWLVDQEGFRRAGLNFLLLQMPEP